MPFQVGRPLVAQAVRRDGVLVLRPEATCQPTDFDGEVDWTIDADAQFPLTCQPGMQSLQQRMRIVRAIDDQAVRLTLMRLDLGAIDLESDLAHAATRIVHPANEHAAPQFFRAAAGQRGDQNCIGILAFCSTLIQLLAPVGREAAQGLALAGTLAALTGRTPLPGSWNSRNTVRCCCNWA